MSKIKTLLQIWESVLFEGQYEGSQDLDPPGDTTIRNDFVNKALVRGRELIIGTWQDYFTIPSLPFTVAAGTAGYALPADFEHLRQVEMALDSSQTRWIRLHPVDLADTQRHSSSTSRRYRYRMAGGATPLNLYPTPGASTDVIRVHYIPYAPELSADGDTITINVDVEYELYVQLALRKCKIREDLDTSAIDASINDCVMRLSKMADQRDAGEPFYLGDYRSGDEDWCL